jgi:hypothetical protein
MEFGQYYGKKISSLIFDDFFDFADACPRCCLHHDLWD